MNSVVKLSNFTDFDRLLMSSNFIVTIIGSIAAFALSYLSVTIIPIPYVPFGLSLSFAFIIATSAYAKNIASSLIVAIAAGVGTVSFRGEPVDFILSYIIFLMVFSLLIGIYSDKLQLMLIWSKRINLLAVIFSLIFIIMSYITREFKVIYNNEGLNLGMDLFNSELPIMEIIGLVLTLVLWLVVSLSTRGQLILTSSSAKNYKILGLVFIFLGYILSIVSIILFTQNFDDNKFDNIADHPYDKFTIIDLFTHQSTNGKYAIFSNPINGFVIASTTIILFTVGISIYKIGVFKGNIEGIKGDTIMILISPAIGLFLFFIFGSYYLQNLLTPGGFFISMELFPIYFAIIWSTLIFNQMVAFILFGIFNKLFKSQQ